MKQKDVNAIAKASETLKEGEPVKPRKATIKPEPKGFFRGARIRNRSQNQEPK